MARGKHRSILDKFLGQENIPVFTAGSLLTTILVWAVIIADLLHKPENWGGLAQLWIMIFVPLQGLLINGGFAVAAAVRREYCGWQISLIGIALWFLTILVVFLKRGSHLWP